MLAIDIDDTICQTTLWWIQLFQQHFGNPEGLTPEQIMHTYEIVQYVPYRQTAEAQALIDELVNDEKNRLDLPVIPGAQQALTTLAQTYSLVYLTSRTETHRFKTLMRLENNNFPQLDLIMRPDVTDAYTHASKQFDRKAHYLIEHYPSISGIIDNSTSLATQLQQNNYPGISILFGHTGKAPAHIPYHLSTWEDMADITPLLSI